jgi:predicted RNA-binding protein YlqC (UPF0109 family)
LFVEHGNLPVHSSQMKKLLEEILRSLVDNPEHVEVREIPAGSSAVLYEVRVARVDIRWILGKGGSTMQAIRKVVMAGAGKLGKRAVVELVEETPDPSVIETKSSSLSA